MAKSLVMSYSSKVQLCTVTKPGRFFFFRYGSAKRKQDPLQSGDVLSGYRGLVAGWLGTAGTRQKY